MDNNNMDNMIASLFSKDKDEFLTAFNSEIGERLGDVITDKYLNVSSEIMADQEEPQEESD